VPLATINGTTIHFKTSGAGLPIIFIHPPLLTSANFSYQHAELADQFQVVTFDIRGHGHSQAFDGKLTYELIAEDIKQLMDYLHIDKAFIAGYSTGGSIAMHALLTYPDRFLGGIFISAMSEASHFALKNRIRLAAGLSRWKLTNRLLMLAIAWGNADSRLTFSKLLQDAKNGSARNIQQYYLYSIDYNCTKALKSIEAPVLLLYGEKDRQFRRYYHKLQHQLRLYELILLPDQKHQLPTKASSELNNEIRKWISAVATEASSSNRPELFDAPMLQNEQTPEVHHRYD